MVAAPVLKPVAKGVLKNVVKVGVVAGRRVRSEFSDLVESAKEDLDDIAAETAKGSTNN
jgi:hypothetical protein